MRNALLLVILTLGFFKLWAQPNNFKFTNSKSVPIQLECIESWFAYIPADSYKMEDEKKVSTKAFYMLRVEVPNMLYKLFINDLRSKNKMDELNISMPDTTAWGTHNLAYVDYYFNHPSFNEYPVVSVSRSGVAMFCTWFGEQVKNLKLKKWRNKKISFRLPTEVEWMVAAAAGDSSAVYAWKGSSMRMGKGPWEGDYMANFVRVGDGSVFRDTDGNFVLKRTMQNPKVAYYFPNTNHEADITAPVLNYWLNGYGLYCMTGNVREMVQEEGFTKGGSWLDPGGECTIDFRNTYQKEGYPCEGFRVVAIVE